MNSASARASSVLPTPVGPRNRNEPIGRFGSDRPARERRRALDDGLHGLVLADHPLVQALLHLDQLLDLALHQLRHRDAGPAGDDLGDVLLGDLLGQQRAGLVELVAAPLLFGDDLLELGDLGVLELRRALEVALTLGLLELAARLVQPGDRGLARLDRLLLRLPAGLELRRGLVQVGELGLDRLTAGLRRLVLLALERLALDLELEDPAVHFVDLDRRGLDLHLQPRGGLVDQVDRLVGEEPVGDVALGERGRGDDRGVGDADSVVALVALLEAAQDRDRVVDVGLAHQHRLEAPLQRRVLLDVLAVLVERGRPDTAQLAAGEHRLQQVGRVHRALGGARADDRVQLVDEQDDLTLGLLDLLQHGLEALLELAPVLGAGDQGADVERDHPAVAQRLGHVAVDDPLGEPLDDRRLAHAGLADQYRVVLRPARQHLDHPANLLVAADHRVELVGPGVGGQVAPELLQRLGHLLRVRGGHAAGSLRLVDGADQRVAVGEDVGDAARPVREGEEQVADRDVLVVARRHLLLGPLQHLDEPGRGPDLGLAVAARRRQLGDRLAGAVGDRRDVGGELAQGGGGESLVLL